MRAGNRKESVRELESVSAVCSWQSDLGGEVLLELAMALETVERGEEARKVYGKVRRGGAFFHPSLAKYIRHLIISPPHLQLATVSWSPSVRRNALSLMQGLDMVKQIRRDVSRPRPVVDMQSLYQVSIINCIFFMIFFS